MLPTINHTARLQKLNGRLQEAITAKDKSALLAAFTEAESIDLEQVQEGTADDYELLLAIGNELLNS